ncbi:MAG: hypothetical protein E7420_08875, partial [Ruminococcaceae bacterium]|nr:hypothetical protein [Oscillospiraceae bacterium]
NMWYLEGADASGDKADIAPNWFIRHGMGDADTSYAVVASLILAVEEAAEGEVNAYFGWERNHNGGGNTYYQEFFQWMEDNGWISDDSYTFWDLRNTENVSTAELAITVDGEAAAVTRYWGHYYGGGEDNQLTVGPGMYGPKGERDDLQINIYVPENAADDAAVMFLLNNGSWAQNGFPEDTIVDGGEYDSTGSDRVALALKHGMIVVSYGARCRGSVAIDDPAEFVGHSPATIADTKAAIRYVKYNIGLGNIPGDADKVVISGHSGGGALGSIIASTGNSSDFDEYLVNAAPATDDVFAVMASAPITDLAYADFAYEWTFKDYRADAPYEALSYDAYGEDMMALSEALAAKYVTYVKDMFGLSEEEYTAKIAEIFAASVQHELDLDAQFQYSDIRPETDDRGWFELGADGKVVSFDLEAYTAWLIQNAGINKELYAGNELKGIMAFNSEGMKNGYNRNENNLWGTTAQRYSIAYPELWDMLADPAAIGVDQYADWDEFWAAEGALVGKQMKMVSVMPYLTGSDNMWYLEGADASGDKADIAPNWFIRHGMGDADTSYAVVASLILAVEEAAEGEVNAYFGWERSHNGGGNTYYQEFFQWMEDNGWLHTEEPVVEEPPVEEPPVETPAEPPVEEPQPEPVEEKGNGAIVAIVIIAVIVVAAVVVMVVKKRKAVPEKVNEE